MPKNQNKRLILGNGEAYVSNFEKTFNVRSPEPPRSFEDARDRIKKDLTKSLKSLSDLQQKKKIEDESVLCLRLHPDVTAKSYSPKAIFNKLPQLRSVGSRNYHILPKSVAQTDRVKKIVERTDKEIEARMMFVQSTPDGFRSLNQYLDRSDHTKEFRNEIRRVEAFNVLTVSEQISAQLGEQWSEGRVELVMHPTSRSQDDQSRFLFELFELSGIERDTARIRPYPGGLTFVSCRATRQSLEILAGTNPLRSAHPLRFGGLKNLRSAPSLAGPKPPKSTTRSTIQVGVFDGGIDAHAPLLQGHAEQDDELSVKTPQELEYMAHGTAVAGAILHGSLTEWGPKHQLPAPPVYVVSFRVFPPTNPHDHDLYEAIDIVEQAVPSRPDIKVFNLSFGPEGAIEDDPVSRFTYVLDSLAVAHKVTFCVAVGNDGEVVGEERIQAPSDLVHGLGVGAHTYNGDQAVHAAYSCRGPGRECGKVKPDVSAFGGCPAQPSHLVSLTPNEKIIDWGTSFAAPIASALTAQASESFDRSSALLGRVLVIHTSKHPQNKPDDFLGHGIVCSDIEDIVTCDEHSVTVVFQGGILPKAVVRLPIPWPSSVPIEGMVDASWTIGALSSIDARHPGDYTSCCLEDTFYPNEKVFNFRSPKDSNGRVKTRKLHIEHDEKIIQSLLAEGWESGTLPATDSGNRNRNEQTKRMLDCKWESVVRRSKRKSGSKIDSPFLTLHAIGRNGAQNRFEYAVAVTLTAKKFSGDLYAEIRKQYPALAPIRLRTEAETRVQI